MHVCIVNVAPRLGGIERVIENYVAALTRKRVSFTCIFTPSAGDAGYRRRLESHGVALVPMEPVFPAPAPDGLQPGEKTPTGFPRSLLLSCWKRLVPDRLDEWVHHMRNTARLTRQFERPFGELPSKPDIIHLFAGYYTWLAAAARAARRVVPEARLVLRLGNPPVFLRPTWLERKTFRSADAIMFVSEHTRAAWEDALRTRLPHAGVFPNPVDTERLSKLGKRSKLHTPIVLATIARLSPIKGVDVALRAVKELHATGVACRLLVMGSGPEERNLRSLAHDLHVEDAVEFLGFVEDPVSRFEDIDMLLQPSLQTEGIPNSVLEAMASGIPVIATPVGGLPEVISDRKTGLLIPPGEPRALAEAIKSLTQDSSLRERITRGASDLINARFSIAHAGEALLTLYQRALDR